jgi:transposase InsO family protein
MLSVCLFVTSQRWCGWCPLQLRSAPQTLNAYLCEKYSLTMVSRSKSYLIEAHSGTVHSLELLQSTRAFFRTICEAAGVQLSLSTSFHPQTNGLTERTNQVVAAALPHVSADMKDWHSQLPLVKFAKSSAYHDPILSAPFRMNRIALPAYPFDALIAASQQVSTECAGWLGISHNVTGQRTHMQAYDEYRT